MAGFDLNQPINWDEIDDLEGVIPYVNYDFVWDPGNEDGEGSGEERSDGDDDAGGGAEAVDAAETTGINIRKRRHYPPDMKRSIYALCLERSTNGIMKEGVTKSVANDMRVGKLWRVVQRVYGEMDRLVVESDLLNLRRTVAAKNFPLTLMASKMCRLDSAILSKTSPTLCKCH
ncbi:uncharacterized protein LOC127782093 [Oryza glaberrima]|nr:uncharacterized protein LOC127782093 [Oryza glaberrima]